MAWLVRFSTEFSTTDGGASIERELIMSDLWDRGSTGMYEPEDATIVAGFDTEAEAAAVVAHLVTVDGVVAGSATVEPAVTATGSIDDEPRSVPVSTDRTRFDMMIRAGGAFGHGGHPTTVLALDLLTAAVEPNQQVLDVGTGTGILAVAAAMAGASTVVAIDNDPTAVDVANENALRNGVDVQCRSADIAQVMEERRGARFDVVVINVLLPIHRELAEAVWAAVEPGGSIVTAGYLADQAGEVLSIYRDRAGRHHRTGSSAALRIDERRSGDWVAHRIRLDR
ncbi:MAG: 50S ribosomal protein L11 methyltransferase [Acidimicrobiales bacterium]